MPHDPPGEQSDIAASWLPAGPGLPGQMASAPAGKPAGWPAAGILVPAARFDSPPSSPLKPARPADFGPTGRFATRGKTLRFRGPACRFRRDPGQRRARFLNPTYNIEDAMTKRMESKYKIDRRMGQNIWGRPKSPVNRREYGPGQHGQRRKSKLSDYGVQLKAKQKLRGYYGNISETAVPRHL